MTDASPQEPHARQNATTTWRDYFKIFAGVVAVFGVMVALAPHMMGQIRVGSIADRALGVSEGPVYPAEIMVPIGVGIAVVAGLTALFLHLSSRRLRASAGRAQNPDQGV